MKKIIALFICLIMILGLAACGQENSNKNDDTSNNSQADTSSTLENETPDISNSITLDDVMNSPVSPDTDFFCDDNGNGELVLVEYLGNEEIVVIPEKINGKPIVTIGQLVFANKENLKAVKVSNSVRELKKGAFSSSNNIEIVVLGNSVESIGEACFLKCSSLKEVVLNDGLLSIGELAFSYSTNLKSISIPSSVTEIDNSFFSMSESFIIYGEKGSKAESYAQTAGIQFEAK